MAARLRHSPRLWPAAAVALVLVGTVSSIFGAEMVVRSDTNRAHRVFATATAQVSGTLQLAVLHEEDLIVSGSAFFAGNPDSTNAQFLEWASAVQALKRYPELLGFGESVIVPASKLAAFSQRPVADTTGFAKAAEPFRLIPPGRRPYYCLAAEAIQRNIQAALPAGFDFCAGARSKVQLGARDADESAYQPITVGASTDLGVVTPIYRAGEEIATVAQRRSAFVGWIGMTVKPQVVLDEVLLGHRHITVVLRYGGTTSTVAFRSGPIPAGAISATTNLHNGWTVQTFAVLAGGGLFGNGTALALLLIGLALSVLIGLLVLVLATGRVRALHLVGEKTGELRHQALHDALTGLPNRALIMDRIEQLLSRNRRNFTLGAALYIDLDEFKNVNDTLGHAAGDRLLQAVAARLTASLRDVDTIGRMGGDEFVVLIDGASLLSAPELVAERILEVMRQPFELEGVASPLVVTPSIGVAIGSSDAPGELLRNADMALYQAKAAGKNCYQVFLPEMETVLQRRYDLEFDLRSALEGRQFRLVYQPIYDLADLELVGAEALLRWEHPTLGQIQPDEFIPLLESSGQIIEVGYWVLREACHQMAEWRRGGNDLALSVNVSGRQLDRDIVVDHVRTALDESGMEPSALTIEITETALMRNVDTTARRLRELKSLGVQLAIDDFGTGYSSLAYLQRFPVDCLKIDRGFVETISQSPEADALIHTLVQLGKDLGLTTLAEGVETPGQLEHLRREQVDHAQGFLLARPLEVPALEAELSTPLPVGSPPALPSART